MVNTVFYKERGDKRKLSDFDICLAFVCKCFTNFTYFFNSLPTCFLFVRVHVPDTLHFTASTSWLMAWVRMASLLFAMVLVYFMFVSLSYIMEV